MLDRPAAEPPGRYSSYIAVMKEMRWSWDDLQSAPVDLVDEVMMHIHYHKFWSDKRNERQK